MARRLCSRLVPFPSLTAEPRYLVYYYHPFQVLETVSDSVPSTSKMSRYWRGFPQFSRSYARGCGGQKYYDLFGNATPGDDDFRKAWQKEMDEDDCPWTGSEDDGDSEEDENAQIRLEKEIRKVRQKAKEHSDLIDADDSDELRSVWSGSDKYIDKLFEEKPKYRTISELLKAENYEPEELSPGQKARKLAVENALKKLKKGPDGRYISVWEVMSDIDILIGAFENIVSGPEYEELRQGGVQRS